VATRSKSLGGQLLKMTAAGWFEHKGQIRSDCPSEFPVHLAILIIKGGLVKAEVADQVCAGAMLK